ncbi:hypothetical protein SAMN05421767_10549 [Granulicatella balaenopterae]|uniref:DUF3397 domain-containing protein n=1 Tax=Granulicatella balaenopterae TaxID=137733 RepID=A0A1H9ID67_9LACT|nr:hypothetical protein [Granulicatella balaenopterae]SEQ72529.1 hypothetical protein SAMN05421767_10549 [Granulicatella balaenopterae]
MISIFYELSLILALIGCYIALKLVVGKRLYYSEDSYITRRELLLPLTLVWVLTTSRIVLNVSVFPYILFVVSLTSLLVLLLRQKDFNPWVFVHRFFSLSYLLLVLVGVGLEVARIFI